MSSIEVHNIVHQKSIPESDYPVKFVHDSQFTRLCVSADNVRRLSYLHAELLIQ